MDIYTGAGTEGVIDIHKARTALVDTRTINIEGVRRAQVAEITAAALLDIAHSLRPIGAEAADAIRDRAYAFMEEDAAPETDEPEKAPLHTGDLVVVRGGDQPGEIIGMGYDQDSLYALVKWAESGDENRVWAESLERLDNDALDEPRVYTEDEPEDDEPEAIDELVTPAGEVAAEIPDDDDDDDDDFFDTDTNALGTLAEPTPEPTVSPLDALAEKAPAKKKGKK